MDGDLTAAQRKALDHVTALSSGGPLDPTECEITINFHPDRYLTDGRLVLDALAADNTYHSQFVTGLSNGSLSGFPGGQRWEWESKIFDRAYDDGSPGERPVYGALNYKKSKTGGAPRFGSAYFRLAPAVISRATFCYPDSCYDPVHFGTMKSCDLVEYALANPLEDPLDNYIEAQIHGTIDIAKDVTSLVLDPCYQGTEIERVARNLPCSLEWHEGFRVSTEVIKQYPEYRGQKFVELGYSISQEGWIDPHRIGLAVRSKQFDPQDLKKVWHYTARFGYVCDLRPVVPIG